MTDVNSRNANDCNRFKHTRETRRSQEEITCREFNGPDWLCCFCFLSSSSAAPNTSPNNCQPHSLSTNQRTAQSIFFLPVFNLVVCPRFFQLVVSSFHLWAKSSRKMNRETRVWILIWLRRIKLRRVIWLATFQTCPSPRVHGWLVDLMSLDRKLWLVRWEMAAMGLDEQRWQLVDESASG